MCSHEYLQMLMSYDRLTTQRSKRFQVPSPPYSARFMKAHACFIVYLMVDNSDLNPQQTKLSDHFVSFKQRCGLLP